jgi:hypothetical protein
MTPCCGEWASSGPDRLTASWDLPQAIKVRRRTKNVFLKAVKTNIH